MALLDQNDTRFRTAVALSGPHTPSGELKQLLAALETVQQQGRRREYLTVLYAAMVQWVTKDPKEVKTRGSLLLALRDEVEQEAAVAGFDVSRYSDQFDRAAGDWAAWALQRGRLQRARAALHPHFPALRAIEITDQPTGAAGQYAFTDGNAYSEGDRNLAIGETPEGGGKKQNEPRYWLRLGRRVLTAQQDGKCYGRCFSCAAAVIYTLVTDPAFDKLLIEHVGSIGYDHHLVLVGRPNATDTAGTGLSDRESWMTKTVAVDVWQGNLNGNDDFISLASMNVYAAANLKFYCAYAVSTRSADRQFALTLPPPVRGAIKSGIREQAQAALRSQGAETRQVKVDGRWIIEELVNGIWTRK